MRVACGAVTRGDMCTCSAGAFTPSTLTHSGHSTSPSTFDRPPPRTWQDVAAQILCQRERSVRPDGVTGCDDPWHVKKSYRAHHARHPQRTHDTRRGRAYTHNKCDARVACVAVTCGDMSDAVLLITTCTYLVRSDNATAKVGLQPMTLSPQLTLK